MLDKTWRWLPIALGWIALALGLVGLLLPVIPTAPFVVLAAYLFSKGSPRLHAWLREHPRFGRYVRDWEAEQVIPPVGKWTGTLLVAPSLGFALFAPVVPLPAALALLAVVGAILWFVWTRPSHRRGPPD
jgi:uncharacterized protein